MQTQDINYGADVGIRGYLACPGFGTRADRIVAIAYSGLRGEGSTPVALPPPTSSKGAALL